MSSAILGYNRRVECVDPMPAHDPGCVKNSDTAFTEGNRVLPAPRLPRCIATAHDDIGAGEEGHSMRSACPSVLTRPRPQANIGLTPRYSFETATRRSDPEIWCDFNGRMTERGYLSRKVGTKSVNSALSQ